MSCAEVGPGPGMAASLAHIGFLPENAGKEVPRNTRLLGAGSYWRCFQELFGMETRDADGSVVNPLKARGKQLQVLFLLL